MHHNTNRKYLNRLLTKTGLVCTVQSKNIVMSECNDLQLDFRSHEIEERGGSNVIPSKLDW